MTRTHARQLAGVTVDPVLCMKRHSLEKLSRGTLPQGRLLLVLLALDCDIEGNTLVCRVCSVPARVCNTPVEGAVCVESF